MPLTERRRKEIAALSRKKHREALGQLRIEGWRSVAAALDAGAPLVEVLVSPARWEEPAVQAALAKAAVPVHVVPERVLARLADVQTSQGVLAVAHGQPDDPADLHTLRAVLVLDGVQDPGNVGTLLRTAAWFGIEAVVAGPGTADVYGPKVVRAAMGGLWDVRLVRTPDAAALLARLRAAGFHCTGADLAGTPVDQWTPRPPTALVLGSEAHGLSEAVQGMLQDTVTIPGQPARAGVESLNVAVAAGILMQRWAAVS